MAAISSAPRPRAESPSRTRARPWAIRLLLLLALVLCDTLAINGALIGVYYNLWLIEDLPSVFPNTNTVWLFIGVMNLAFMLVFFGNGLYAQKRGVSRVDEAFRLLIGVSLSTFMTLVINYLLPLPSFGRDSIPLSGKIILLCWGAAVLATIVLRLLYRGTLAWFRRRGFDIRRVLIVGAHAPGQMVSHTIARAPGMGYRVKGFLSDTMPIGALVDGIPVLGQTAALARVVRATQADEVIIALSGRSSSEVMELVALAEDQAVEIKLYPDVFQLITTNEVSIGDVSGLPLISIKNVALDNPINQALKRALDLAVAVIALTLLAPMMLLIAAFIKFDSPGPVFFIQERVGLDGKLFPCIKFRGMLHNAPALSTWTTENDPRVTAFGAFLRRYSLDELPQFINVLRGDMSVVGPRPEQQVWVDEFSQRIPRYVRRHQQKSGITGWAQVNGLRGDSSIEERTRYDLYYIEKWSLLFDIKIIIQTAAGIFTGKLQGY